MDKYILELHWINVRYVKTGKDLKACLDGAYFSGPALRIANRIACNESIRLDFTDQYVIFLKNYYIATLSWGDVIYAGNIVYLKDAIISIDSSCKVPKFLCDDFLVIDTSCHEEDIHVMYLNYPARTFSSLRESYVF